MTIELSAADRALLSDAARAVACHDMATATEAFVLEAQVQAGRLSDELRRTLFAFRRAGSPFGGLLLGGVPLGELGPTPARPGDAAAAPAAAAMSVLLACLGEQYGFRPELGGRIVQDILPVPGCESQQISTGSTVDLECHTEMAFSPLRSDFVALLCLRQDHERRAGTPLSSIDAMLPQLDEHTIAVLREPRFRTQVDASFGAGDVWVDGIRVLTGPPERPHLRVDFAETAGTDPAAQEALGVLRAAAKRTQIIVRLRPGDLLLVDNHRALHGRTAFVPRYDGADRWLLRSFVTKDLRRSEHARAADGRIVEPDYAATAAT